MFAPNRREDRPKDPNPEMVPLSQGRVDEALDIFRSLGFSRLASPEHPEFEAHLQSNGQFLVFDRDLMASIHGLSFYSEELPGGVPKNNPNLDRRFSWTRNDFLTGMEAVELTAQFFNTLIQAGVISRVPLAIVTEDPVRIRQLESLGQLTQGRFCKEITLPFGDLRLYSGIRQLPRIHVPG